MSLYDGLSVETAPVPEIFSSSSIQSLSTDEEESSKKDKSKKTSFLPDNSSSSLNTETKLAPVTEHAPPAPSISSSWSSSSMKLMASNMMRQQMAASRVRTVGRGGMASRGRKHLPVHTSHTTVTQSSLFEDDIAGGIQDEYDPLIPNNYDDIKKAEKDKTREAQNRERESRAEHYKKYSRDSDSDDEEREERRRRKKSQKGSAVPPPAFAPPPPPPPAPIQKPDDETKVVRSALEELSKLKAPKANPYAKKNFKTSAVASNIMTKYGWQEGQGLGKESQGISTALSVEKTSFKGGKIVNVAAEREQVKEEERKIVKSLTEIVKNPTKVILLENMVGAGEVDNELQPEVIEECTKYGEVTNCLIYEIPEGASDDEAVRIFVEFGKKDSAIKAVIDLNGRFFGGRTIRAGFYSEERFSNFDLAPK